MNENDRRDPSSVPSPGTCALRGMTLAAFVGAIGGLIRGLHVYPPTAGFAALELGIPAAFVGALIGLIVGVCLAIINGGNERSWD